MTHKLKRPVAFLSAFVMVMAMLLYFPGGTSSLDFGLKASAATISPTKPSTNSNGVYRIGTAAELYWFVELVNSGNTSANAVLTDNITVNTNVLVNGTLNSNTDNFTSWTPIGKNTNIYTGTFDGQNHTISGLYFNDASIDYVGLFGYSKGTVKNVGVVDSYFNGDWYVGGVCGNNNYGTITNCYNTGAISGNSYIGGVCGNNFGTITNCYYLDSEETDSIDGTTFKTTEQFASGEVAYLLSQGENGEIWGQEIGTDPYPVLKGKRVLTNVNCSAFANDIIVYGQSASLDGTIGFNIYVSADDSYEWDKTVNGVQGEKMANGLYKFTYQVAAKDMDEKINFTVNDKIDVTVSVSDYLAVLSISDNESLKNLADSMSVYGDAAKAYFSGEAVAEQTVTDDLSVYDFTVGTMPEGISYYGSSLILESETTVRHYFKLDTGYDINSFKFYVDSDEVTPVAKQDYYYIDIENIGADKLSTAHTVKIGNDVVISNYSALSYAKTVLDNYTADDNLKNLVKALYIYNRAAVRYDGWVQD